MYDTRTERTVRQVKVKSIVIDFEAHNPAYVVAERGPVVVSCVVVSLTILGKKIACTFLCAIVYHRKFSMELS